MEIDKESIMNKIFLGYLANKNLDVSVCSSLLIGLLVGLISGLMTIPAHGVIFFPIAVFIFVFMGLINSLAVWMSVDFISGLVAIPATVLCACFSYGATIGLLALIKLTLIAGIRFLFS